MCGNVAQWCQDRYDEAYYGQSPRTDPPGPRTGDGWVIRGAGWDWFAPAARSASRAHRGLRDAGNNVGFRLVRARMGKAASLEDFEQGLNRDGYQVLDREERDSNVYLLAARPTAGGEVRKDPDGKAFPQAELKLFRIHDGSLMGRSLAVLYMAVTPHAALNFHWGAVLAFVNHKEAAGTYAMDGSLFEVSPDLKESRRTSVFSNANWGWYPRFEFGKVVHFSLAGNFQMRDREQIGQISPADAERRSQAWKAAKRVQLPEPTLGQVMARETYEQIIDDDALDQYQACHGNAPVPPELAENVYQWLYTQHPNVWKEERLAELKALAGSDPAAMAKVRAEEIPLAHQVLARLDSIAGYLQLFKLTREPDALRRAIAQARSDEDKAYLEREVLGLIGPSKAFVAFCEVEGDTVDQEQTLHGLITTEAGKTHTTSKQFNIKLKLAERAGSPVRLEFPHQLDCRVTLKVKTRLTLGSKDGQVETNTQVRNVRVDLKPGEAGSVTIDFGRIVIAGAYTGDQGMLGDFLAIAKGDRGEREWRYAGSDLECAVTDIH